MLSIFVLYSSDRTHEMRNTIACLREMAGYEECQKIVVSDGPCDLQEPDFEIVEIEREPSGLYCWAKTWEAGVTASRYERVLYIDSDRVAPKSFLQTVESVLADGRFVFPDKLFWLRERLTIDRLKEIRDDPMAFESMLIPDHRIWDDPAKAIARKNPMSGCVAFTKKTFEESGGLDWNYQGWGYPDTDYFMKTKRMGCEFIAVDAVELHQKHDYRPGTKTVRLMNLWNGMMFVRKWGVDVPNHMFEEAASLGVNLRLVDRHQDVDSFVQAAQKPMKLL